MDTTGDWLSHLQKLSQISGGIPLVSPFSERLDEDSESDSFYDHIIIAGSISKPLVITH